MIIDMHCDTISRIYMHCDTISRIYYSRQGDKKIVLAKNNLNVDIEKLQKSDYLLQFFAAFINMDKESDPYKAALGMIDCIHDEIQKNSDAIAEVRSFEDIQKNRDAGKVSALLTVEEGGILDNSLSRLEHLYDLGVRLVTLTWNYKNCLGMPSLLQRNGDQGLTPFGIEVVEEMNRLGMLIDVSHLSDEGFWDVLKYSREPFVASHSNARSATPIWRNLTDEMIVALAERGGLMGINFCGDFLTTKQGMNNDSLVEDMVRHIRYIYNIGGSDVLALGSDFDGIPQNLEIKGADEMEKLYHALKKSGFNELSIEKIFYKNALNILKVI